MALCVLLGLQGVYPFTLCGLLGLQGGILHNFGPLTVGAPPQVAKNGPLSQGPIQRIYQRRGRSDFPIFGLAGVDFLHFGFVRLHFLSFWPSGPSFWLLGLHFGLWGVHFATSGLEGGILWLFVSFWAFRGVSFCSLRLFEPSGGYPSQLRASDRGPPPHKLPKTVRFPKVPYKEFISAAAGSIFQFLGLWALIFFILALYAFLSFHFGLLGLHFSFSASILAFGASLLPLRALRGGLLWLFVAFWAFRGGILLLFVAF